MHELTPTDRFPYEHSPWCPQPPIAQRWYEALERSGPENVRARLAQLTSGSASAVAIGTEPVMTKGFAEEWLAWQDRRGRDRETALKTSQIFWTRWAALAASVAAAAAAVGWLITLLGKK